MVFIPGYSSIREPEQNEEENAEEYALSQKQRSLERKLRNDRRDLEVLKARNAPAEEIEKQKARVDKSNKAINDFCSETGRARRRSRERTPIDATWPDTENPGGTVRQFRDKYVPVNK